MWHMTGDPRAAVRGQALPHIRLCRCKQPWLLSPGPHKVLIRLLWSSSRCSEPHPKSPGRLWSYPAGLTQAHGWGCRQEVAALPLSRAGGSILSSSRGLFALRGKAHAPYLSPRAVSGCW